MQIQCIKGNILNVKADAMVLPANKALREGSGVSTVMFQAAGRKNLTDACRKIGTCEEGNAVVTLAYDLDADYIVHAVVPRWEDGKHGEYDRLCAAYLAALKAADITGRETIAFPLLGSGNNGYNLELALEIAIKSIEEFQPMNLKVAYLVIYGNRISDIVSGKGYSFTVVPNEYMKRKSEKPRNNAALEKGLGAVKDFFGNKENVDNILDTAVRIVKLVALIKGL